MFKIRVFTLSTLVISLAFLSPIQTMESKGNHPLQDENSLVVQKTYSSGELGFASNPSTVGNSLFCGYRTNDYSTLGFGNRANSLNNTQQENNFPPLRYEIGVRGTLDGRIILHPIPVIDPEPITLRFEYTYSYHKTHTSGITLTNHQF